ncbi:MAG: AraC family transcriptional regulator [Peptococcaceae bacterium]|nr:MAG: AraC family transcriptional regulator [Peptococcaceae bacterium]
MNNLKAKVAYLQGLSNGLGGESADKEGKLLKEIINTLSEFANSVDSLEGYVESIDEDLQHLESEIYEDGVAGEGAEGQYLEAECPGCGETVCFDSAILEDDDLIEITCPECDEVVFVNDEDYLSKNKPDALDDKAAARILNVNDEDI